MAQGQVNHKCTVAGLPKDAPTRATDAHSEATCADLLAAARCIQAGSQEMDRLKASLRGYGDAMAAIAEKTAGYSFDADDKRFVKETHLGNGKAAVNDVWAHWKPGKAPTMPSKRSGTGTTPDAATFKYITNTAVEYDQRTGTGTGTKPLRDGLEEAYGPVIKELMANFKATGFYRANQQQLAPLVTGALEASDKIVKHLNGPQLGPNGCMADAAKIMSDGQAAGGKDAGREAARGKGSGKERAANAEAIIVATSAGSATIEVVYDLQYKEQCILLSQISPLAEYSYALDNVDLTYDDTKGEDGTGEIRRRLPYKTNAEKNAPLVVDGESFGFINKLTQYPGMGAFYDMTPAQISGLQPMIRLYRVEGANSRSADSREVEVYFDSNLKDSKTILENKAKRGFGVGIQSFDVVFDGQDMFAQKRCIKANLTLFANDFEELLLDRGGFRYVDLALKTGASVKAETKNYKVNDELNFRLKAVFGWQMPPPAPGTGDPIGRSVRGALKNTFVSVNLTPVTHTFDFDEFGRVKFNIEYLAYVEEFYAKPQMNIFTDAENYAKILKRKMAFESANRTLDCGESADLAEKVKEIKSSDQQAIKKEKSDMHAYLLKQMFLQNHIHFLNFAREDLESVIKLGPFHDVTSGKIRRGSQSMNATLSDDLKNSFESEIKKSGADKDVKKEMMSSLMVAGQDSVNIAFFYVGDLLDVILGSMDGFLSTTKSLINAGSDYQGLAISEEIKSAQVIALKKSIEEYKKFRVVMGPLEIVDHSTETAKYVSFSDVPISVKYFSEWLTSKLKKKEQALYPLTQFLKDLFNDLLKNYLNDDSCFPFSIKQKVRLFESVITSYPTVPGIDEITAGIISSPVHSKYNRLNSFSSKPPRPILNIRGASEYGRPNKGIGNEMNYFVFFAGRTQPMNLMNGNRSADRLRGIHHYLIGEDKGLLKKIALNKTDSPGLKEVRFEQEGYDGLHQLREIYDVEIDSYANVTAFPGNYIFVDPQGFAPQMASFKKSKFDLTDLGVGGYYMVTKASHQFGPGIANTKLNAVWVAGAGSAAENAMVEAARGANQIKSAKCLAKQSYTGKTGTTNNAAFYEYTGTGPDFSSLDENPAAPPGSSAAGSAANAEAGLPGAPERVRKYK